DLGTLFKLDSDGTLTTMYQFSGPDGAYPQGLSVRCCDGDIWGTTKEGGTDNFGTVFHWEQSGRGFLVGYSFDYTNGARPNGSVFDGGSNYVYGTTFGGGTAGYGNIFVMVWGGIQHHRDWTMAVVHEFNGADGANPSGGLSPLDSHLYTYGTTFN